MANPIIKIKRGSGEPPVWNDATSIGITAGEFAFDRSTGMLYLGVTGQYLEQNFPGLCALGGPFVIPVGAQISNDENFGSGGDLGNLGYSEYTIPTTKAVREYVLNQKAAAAFGFTLQAGNGISFAYPGEDVLRINNEGALQAFSQIQLQAQNGGVVTGTTTTTPIGSTFGILKFLPQSGIKIGNSITNGVASVTVENIGVTGINGVTGNITSFLPVQSLAGYTSAINNIALETFQVQGLTPITATKIAEASTTPGITFSILQVSHQEPFVSTQSGDFSVGGFSNGYMYVPAITFDKWGHAKYTKGITLFGDDGIIPAGLTEAVQDIVGDSSFTRAGLGMNISYNDLANTLTYTNTGIRGFTAGGTTINDGIVTIVAGSGSGITITGSNTNPKTITIGQNIPYFKNFTLGGNVDTSGSISADNRDDTLTINAGTGIQFTPNYNDDTFTINNHGVTRLEGLTGEIDLVEGTGVSISTNAGSKTITISALGGGGGEIGTIEGQYNLNGSIPGQGVCGFVSIEGLSHGVAHPNQYYSAIGQNIITYSSDEVKNGTILVDLSSNIKVPTDELNYAQVTIPNRDILRQYGSDGVLKSLNQLSISENNLIVPLITAGATGAAYYDGDGTVNNDINPGKELIITAAAGTASGLSPTPVWNASIVVSAYPTNQNFASYLIDGGYSIGDCPESGCVGFPPIIGECNGAAYNGTTELEKGSVSILANAIVDGAIAIKDDIFLMGNIYGNGGCKLDIGAASQASNYFDEFGTLRNPGGIYLNGSTADPSGDSNRAIFNVDEFFIKDRLVTIGGASGNGSPINNGQFGTTMDVGFLMPSYLSGQARTAFIGIDTDDGNEGTFKFIPTASLNEDGGRFVTGNVGPAKFDTVNGVGISGGNTVSIITNANSFLNDSDRLVIRDRNTSGTANISFKGAGNITFSTGGNISLAQNAAITIGTTNGRINQQMIGSGILDFTSSLYGLTFEQTSNSLQIKKRNSSSQVGTYTFPSITNTTSLLVDTTSTQTLQAKTIGENCVIDCGSY